MQQNETKRSQSSSALPCGSMTKPMNNGLMDLVSMSLISNDSNELFSSSAQRHHQQPRRADTMGILDEILSNGLLTPIPSAAVNNSSGHVDPVSPQGSILGDLLEPTPLSPQFSLKEGNRPAPMMLNTSSACTAVADNGALDRLIAKELDQTSSSASEPSSKAKRTFLPESPEKCTSLPAASAAVASNKRLCTSSSRRRNDHDENQIPRFRDYQETGWMDQFKELVEYKKTHGHCLVPHTFQGNPVLARWVKRQRYQYKLKKENKGKSTMTDARIEMLESIGFVWDSHAVAWEERLEELKEFQAEFGHCIVPSNYQKSPSLATWVKCQRRQNKLFWSGERSSMTQERFRVLCELGFTWELRRSKKQR